ncbi:hypothetical protein [Wolbachia endosymbiont (group B) of Limnophora tigrina]|uniref:hypothetical protein n=1 Tax=Wolbachia endosymbiont (group B) of Limnophora tigrina TaxID=3139317 RepID=UPI0035B556C6
MNPPRKMSFQRVTLESSLYHLVEIKFSGFQCLGTGMTPSWMEISVSYLDNTTFVWKPVSP